jgi:hypothetical protein
MGARIEQAIGPVDGTNTYFSTSVGYISGSLDVFLNGILLRKQDDDGWVELAGTNFEMKRPPSPGDIVSVFYRT